MLQQEQTLRNELGNAYRHGDDVAYLQILERFKATATTDIARALHARYLALFLATRYKDYARAVELCKEALPIADPDGKAFLWCLIVFVAQNTGDVAEGLAAAKGFEAFCKQHSGALRYRGRVLIDVGWLRDLQGTHKESLGVFEEAIRFYETPGCPDEEPACFYGSALMGAALQYRALGNLQTAMERMGRAREILPPARKGIAAAYLALLAIESGVRAKAFIEAAERLRDSCREPDCVDAIMTLAQAARRVRRGDKETAVAHLDQAAKLASRIGSAYLGHQISMYYKRCLSDNDP